MEITIYETLGLSPNEAKIYESLIEQGEVGVSEIAINAKIHRRNAYDAIHRLIEKGLCFEIFSAQGSHYRAVDPNKLVELLAEREMKLQQALPELTKKFQNKVSAQEAYIYRGIEGQKNIFRDILRIGQDSYFIGAKGGWLDPRLQTMRISFFKEANKKKIKFIQLFDYEMRSQFPGFNKMFLGELQYRFLPKEYSTNSVINIFGDYVVTYTGLGIGEINEDTVFFVLRSPDLAKSYRTWFWCMWEQSKEDKNKK